MSRNIDPVWLLDVNALIAFFDIQHVDHHKMRTWFDANFRQGWATCPLTENGLIRVLSQPAYPNGGFSSADVIENLDALKADTDECYMFCPDDISLTDRRLLQDFQLIKSAHLTDLYLLALAYSRRMKLVSFDQGLPWRAIRGASPDLIVRPA